jgi:4-amino-4-deoxy-L-arabinose transferase-like glycosyltransferase
MTQHGDIPAAVGSVATRGSTLPLLGAAAVVVVAWVVLELWGLGAVPFSTKGEPREALVVWEMTHGGGWILPRRNGVELPSKPPLFHWLGALTSLLRGTTDEWSIRFPSAALSLLGALGVLLAGASLWTPRAGLLAALALMTMFEWARAATNARVDMSLTAGLELAFLSLLFFLRSRDVGWLAPLYVGISVAVLGKGPIGLVLPGLTALIMFAVTRDFTPLRQMRLIRGACIVLALAGTWYALALWLGGWEFFQKQILSENLMRVVDSADDVDYVGHRHSVLYLLGALLLGTLPWTLFFPAVGRRLWRQRQEAARTDARVFLLVWIALVFAVYAAAVSKRSVYLLGLYPALALLLGWWGDARACDATADDAWLRRVLPVPCVILIAAFGLIGLITVLERAGVPVGLAMQGWLSRSAQPYGPVVGATLRADSVLVLACVGVAIAALVWCMRAARNARWIGVFAGLFLATAATVVCTRQVILPGIAAAQSLQSFMRRVRRVVGSSDLSFYKTFSYGAVYYWGGHIPVYDGPWPEAPEYLLVARERWDAAPPAVRDQYEVVPFPDDGKLGEARRYFLVRRVRVQ